MNDRHNYVVLGTSVWSEEAQCATRPIIAEGETLTAAVSAMLKTNTVGHEVYKRLDWQVTEKGR